MSVEVVSILVLVAVFLAGTVLPINMGALALVAAYIVGVYVVDPGTLLGEEDNVDGVFLGFPGDLFIILVGVTYLFAIARDNGTVDWLVDVAVSSVGGRIALIPWVMFGVTAVLTAFGAVVPVAIVAPIAMGFAVRYEIRPILMGLMVVNGATAGGFSPLSVFGTIANDAAGDLDLNDSPLLLFVSSLVFNIVLGVITYVLFGGRASCSAGATRARPKRPRRRRPRQSPKSSAAAARRSPRPRRPACATATSRSSACLRSPSGCSSSSGTSASPQSGSGSCSRC